MYRRTATVKPGEVKFKVIILGDAATGKSCLVSRYVYNTFQEAYEVTLGAQFATQSICIDDHHKVNLQIWDTAGQECFRAIIRNFYFKSSAILLTFNIVDANSFASLERWILEAKDNAPKNVVFVLIGTHLDLEAQRQVERSRAEQWMRQHNISMFFETSAKNAINVTAAFEEIAKQLFLRRLDQQKQKGPSTEDGVKIGSQQQTSIIKRCC